MKSSSFSFVAWWSEYGAAMAETATVLPLLDVVVGITVAGKLNCSLEGVVGIPNGLILRGNTEVSKFLLLTKVVFVGEVQW
jgi:hypothetical protein